MKIAYLFSKNDKIGSKLIRWASRKERLRLGEDMVPSHVAVLLNDKFVIESVLGKGVRMIPYDKWKKINVEVFSVPSADSSDAVFSHLSSVWGKPYDWRGILYFGYAFIRMMYRGEHSLQDHNPWQRDSHFFCTEFAGRLMKRDLSMTTPGKLLDELSNK